MFLQILRYHLSSMQALRLNSETFPATSEEIRAFSAAGVEVLSSESIDSELAKTYLPLIDALLVVLRR